MSYAQGAFFVKAFCFIFAVEIAIKNYSDALFVAQNERRQLDSLDGLWTFVREPPNSVGIGLRNNWASLELAAFENSSLIPVPAAYNDLTADSEQRDHFFNGELVAEHVGGHLPFQVEVQLMGLNLITVAVNNTLSRETIPPGDFSTIKLSSGRELVNLVPHFDFFNYAGILRSVYIWHLPQILIRGIRIQADHSGFFSYRIDIDEGVHTKKGIQIRVGIYTFEEEMKIYELFGAQNSTNFDKIELWWPKGMGSPNLYTAEIRLESVSSDGSEKLLDVYRETFGFRTVTVDQNRIYINGLPFYCHGFGMHEDIGIHGRGFDRATMVKDLNMFDWLNGNCYRTSHYPYAEERAHLADRRGIAVITEVPSLRLFLRSTGQLLPRMLL
uniref:Beta-glucuronidase n=1 Tax=Globodera pallida TaxID=36090 RepID=A0A183BQW4_GLOPA